VKRKTQLTNSILFFVCSYSYFLLHDCGLIGSLYLTFSAAAYVASAMCYSSYRQEETGFLSWRS